MIEIVNRQRKIPIEADIFSDFTEKAGIIVSESKNKDFTVAFVSDRKMKELNKTFRAKNSTTDVLSFPFENEDFQDFSFEQNYLGDIIISAEQAEKQAKENNLSFEIEVKQLILHGILHLCGYDHETDDGKMNRLEIKYRRKLGIE